MFEKEAEEYAEKTSSLAIKKFNPLEPKLLSIGFQDGAEFGYNKANEWHFVKDGDLPKEEGTYLVYISGNLLVDRWHNGKWMLHFNTYAWKEIVLPKESE